MRSGPRSQRGRFGAAEDYVCGICCSQMHCEIFEITVLSLQSVAEWTEWDLWPLNQRFSRCDRTPLTRWSMLWVAISKHHGKEQDFTRKRIHSIWQTWVFFPVCLRPVERGLASIAETRKPSSSRREPRPSTISMLVCRSNSYIKRIIQWYYLPFWRSQRRRMQSARSSCNAQSKPHHFVMICCTPSMR